MRAAGRQLCSATGMVTATATLLAAFGVRLLIHTMASLSYAQAGGTAGKGAETGYGDKETGSGGSVMVPPW